MKSALLLLSWILLAFPTTSIANETEYDLDWIVTHSQLNDLGRRIFMGQSPSVIKDVQQVCGTAKHGVFGVTYGCYIPSKEKVYIKSMPTKDLAGMMAVTATHETLHIIYRNLPEDFKRKINYVIDKELAGPNREEILSSLKGYSVSEYYNEAHSFIATEVENIDPLLEDYYSKIILDRKALVAIHKASDRLEIQKQAIANSNSELNELKKNIDANTEKLDFLEKVIRPLQSEMDLLKAKGSIETYNSLVSTHNTFTDIYKSISDKTQADAQKGMETTKIRDAIFQEHLNLMVQLTAHEAKSESKSE